VTARPARCREPGDLTPIIASASLDLVWALAGLVVLAFAEAFAAGRSDLDGHIVRHEEHDDTGEGEQRQGSVTHVCS
jgi:hypothetical protein